MQQRPESQPDGACQAIAERLLEHCSERLCVLIPERRPRIALQPRAGVEHLERVLARIEVVVAALLNPMQRVELGQHDRARAQLRQHPDARRRRLAGEDPRELAVHTLGRDARKSRRGQPRRVARGGRLLAARARRRAAPVVSRAAGPPATTRPGESQHAAPKVLDATQRVDERTAVKRLGDCVDGEVAQRQVGLDRAAAQRVDVELPARFTRDDAPRPETL